jgi:glucose/arabinose dehydrogenase
LLSQGFRSGRRIREVLAAALLFGAWSCTETVDSESASHASRVGLSFVPIETHTAGPSQQTVAHMELTGLIFLPDDRGLLVWEKGGRVSHYEPDDHGLALLGEFRLDDVATDTDCGLISIALDPDWSNNHFVYAAHCISVTHSAVTRYEFHADDYDRVTTTAARVIEFGDPKATKGWHNVGTIGFFDDREHSMWVLTGEKKDPDNAQDPSTNLGGVLRIIPNRDAAGSGYEPHPDNPFGGPGSDPELQSSPDLYAWGFRSPWRGTIDDQNRIWVGEVGNAVEEINLVSSAGQNFGWGDEDGPCVARPGNSCKSLTNPVAWWGRGSNHRYRLEDDHASATVRRVAWVGVPYETNAGDPYEGFLDGATLIGDMCVGFVRALSVDPHGRVVRDDSVGHLIGLSGAAQAPNGQLYVTSFGACTSDSYGIGGGIYRVELDRHQTPSEPAPPIPTSDVPLVDDPLGPVPLKLSDTGIFADSKHTKPIERAIRYEPSLPLWTNNSAKERWVVLPEGGQIDNTRRDHWEFPVGTLIFKTFSYAGEDQEVRVETRLLRRMRDGWDYQAYKWRGDDADLLSLERSVPVTNKPSDALKFKHEIPSRFDCRSCHESNETVVIGFDELRLSGTESGESQLEALAAQGVFKQPLPSDPDRVNDPDATTREVLGYLHGNCAHCHNASDNTMSKLDLTHRHALANLIGKQTEGSGQASGVRVMPGAPERSILFLAMSGEGDDPELQAMPPVGVQVRDKAAIKLIRSWISALPH